MILSSVDFPAPFGPSTPILAPWKNESQIPRRISRLGGTTLRRSFMTNAYSPAMALLKWGTPVGFPIPLRFALLAYAVAVAIAIAIAAAVAVAVAAAVAVAVVITTRRRRVGVGARASCSGPAR